MNHALRTSLARRFCSLTIACVVLAMAAVDPAQAVDAKDIHTRAWNASIDSMPRIPAARYGMYAYRSLAVMHPEVYLAADRLTLEVLAALPGSRLAYHSRDVRDVELHLRIARRETQGGGFNIGMMSIVPDSIFDSQSPKSLEDWLDVRVPSIAILLKSDSPRLSTFECAVLRHAHLTEVAPMSVEPFIVIDRRGVGYLATDSALWTAGLSNRPVENWKEVRPVAVFNRQSVYSALTGRDDRSRDSSLARLLSRLGKVAEIPRNGKERDRIALLNAGTSLPDNRSLGLARLVASGLADRKQPLVDSLWNEQAGANDWAPCADLFLEEAYFWANKLSGECADLASQILAGSLPEALDRAEQQYLAWIGRRISPTDTADRRVEAWGCIWSYDLFLTSVVDNRRARAGSALSQAIAMAAALNLAGIEYFNLGVQLGDKQIPDQYWVFADTGRHQFNLGVWTDVPPPTGNVARPISLLISGYSLNGRAVRIGTGQFCSSFDELTVGETLTRIARQLPLANLSVSAPTGKLTPLQKFLFELTGDEYEPVVPRWHNPVAP